MKTNSAQRNRDTGFCNMAVRVLFEKRALCLLLVFQLFCFGAFAQTIVTGRVSDSKGESLSSVSITIKGSANGTTTGNDGRYSINVPAKGTLVFTLVGYADQEVAVNNQRTINVVLTETSKSLESVVVIAYGTVKRRDLKNATSNKK